MKASGHTEVCPRGGFTLVELLAVIAVIAVVASLVIGAAGIAGKKADVARAETDIALIREALDLYRKDYGSYPHSRDLSTWEMNYNNLQVRRLFDPLTNYVAEVRFTDPWGKSYWYLCDTNESALSYVLKSAGPDGAFGHNNIDKARDNISNRR